MMAQDEADSEDANEPMANPSLQVESRSDIVMQDIRRRRKSFWSRRADTGDTRLSL